MTGPATTATGQIIPKGQREATIGQLLNDNKAILSALIPPNVQDKTRLITLAYQCAQRTPALLQCTPLSLMNAMAEAFVLGLEIGTARRQAYLVPYAKQATLIVGYMGFVQMMYDSGEVLPPVQANVVREGDDFEYDMLNDRITKHVPLLDPAKPMTHVYTRITMKDGRTTVHVMSKAQVEKIRNRSRAKNDGPWVTDEEWMWKKTCIKQHAKLMPLDDRMNRVIANDDLVEAGMKSEWNVVDEHPLNLQAIEAEGEVIAQERIVDTPAGAVNNATGEVVEPEDVSQDPDAPTPVPQGNCPEHALPWEEGEHGGLYHYVDGVACTPAQLLTKMAAPAPLNWQKADLDRWLKDNFSNKTAAKLSGPEVLAAYNGLAQAQRRSAEEPAPEPAEAATAESIPPQQPKLS